MTNPPIPESGSALTADWIEQALAAGGATGLPAIRDMLVEDIGTGSGALGEILRCTMRYENDGVGAPGSVVVKLCSSDKKSVRIARLLEMYKREYSCFRQLAPHMPINLPALLYGDLEEAGHRFVLVLEDLQGMEAMDQISGASAARARRAIRGVAELHGQFWNKLDQPPVSSFLASVRPQRRWVTQLLYLICLAPCMRRFGSLFSNRMRRLAEAYGPRVTAHMDELESGPQTLTHGDFRLENMFFGAGKSDAFTVIDWQASGRLCCKLGEGAMRNQGASCSPYDSALARRSCSHAMASVRAHGPRPKARSTIRASPTMPPWRANIPAWPLRSARITSKPLIVA